MRRPVKRDANHAALVDSLRANGFAVTDLAHVGGGVPDLFISRGHVGIFVEVKNPEKRAGKKRGAVQAATDAREAAFRSLHPGLVVVATCTEDVLAAWPAGTD